LLTVTGFGISGIMATVFILQYLIGVKIFDNR